jgi:hypothetical protein
MSLGTILRIWDVDGDQIAVDPKCEGALETAFRKWAEQKVDTALSLTLAYGDETWIRASDIRRWSISTEAGRFAATKLEAVATDEERENCRLAGLPVKEAWD